VVAEHDRGEGAAGGVGLGEAGDDELLPPRVLVLEPGGAALAGEVPGVGALRHHAFPELCPGAGEDDPPIATLVREAEPALGAGEQCLQNLPPLDERPREERLAADLQHVKGDERRRVAEGEHPDLERLLDADPRLQHLEAREAVAHGGHDLPV
jgi:hypothetical protein